MSNWKRTTTRTAPSQIPGFAPVFPPDWRVLYQMSPQQQESIRDWLKEFNLAETRQRVESQLGVKLSRPALEYLQQGHLLCFQLQQAMAVSRMLQKELQQASFSPVDSELVSQAIQVCFEQRALATGDLDGFARLRRLRQQDQLLELRKREFDRREETDNQRALKLLAQELRHRPDCLELFETLRFKILGPA